METLLPARSPLAVLHVTILLCILGGATLVLSLVFALVDPVWSRAALALHGLTLIILILCARWRPPRRLGVYALLLAGTTYLWDPSLPPPHLPEGHTRGLLPLSLIVAIIADVLLLGRAGSLFAPQRMIVRAGCVDLVEAAYFFRRDPDELRGQLQRRGYPILSSDDGSELVGLDDLLATLGGGGPELERR
jgi:hypothetical protein